jgi:hypothetical protein
MYPYDASALARVVIEERIREANHQRLAREFLRSGRPSTARTAAQVPQRHSRQRRSRLWNLAHIRHAYN